MKGGYDRRIAKLEDAIGFEDWHRWLNRPIERWPDSALDAAVRHHRLVLFGIPESEPIDDKHLIALMRADEGPAGTA